MTRRERLERIIRSFDQWSYTRRTFFRGDRLDILNDAAIEELARAHLADLAAHKRMIVRNRRFQEAASS